MFSYKHKSSFGENCLVQKKSAITMMRNGNKTSLRAIAKQSRRMQGVHALATGLPRRCAPHNDIIISLPHTMSLRSAGMGLRVGALWQSRRMQGVHALATGLPRRCAPRNDIFYNFTSTHHVIAKRRHGVARWRAVAISSHASVHALVTGGAAPLLFAMTRKYFKPLQGWGEATTSSSS
jgi:hypothetical protein